MSSDDLRYPTGPFASLGRPLRPDERSAHIDTIAEHPTRMRAAVAGLSDAQLDTPYREGGWTARQVVHHVVDSHLNAYVRFKLAVTEDRPTICTYEEKLWAELPDAKSAPVEGSLAMLEHLHGRWVAFLRMARAPSRGPRHAASGAGGVVAPTLTGWSGLVAFRP